MTFWDSFASFIEEARAKNEQPYLYAIRKYPYLDLRPTWVNLLPRPDDRESAPSPPPVIVPSSLPQSIAAAAPTDPRFRFASQPYTPPVSPFAAVGRDQPVSSAFRAFPPAPSPYKRVAFAARDQVIPVGSDFDSSRE